MGAIILSTITQVVAETEVEPKDELVRTFNFGTPLDIGIELVGGLTSTLVKRRTRLPFYGEFTVTTATDNQQKIEIKLVQVESLRFQKL